LLKSYCPERLFLLIAFLFFEFPFSLLKRLVVYCLATLFFFLDKLCELCDALSAKVVGDHQEESRFSDQVVWHLVTALLVETDLHPVFALVTSKMEFDFVTISVRDNVSALALVYKNEASLIELELADEN
jgi:hypothetical protein